MGAMVEISGVQKRFSRSGKRFAALEDINLKVEEGEFVSIVGTSGCGKSTILNIVAGLMRPDEGHVAVRGNPVKGVDRKVGYTFQQASLLPWRTVRSNVEMGLELRGFDAEKRGRIAMGLIEQVGLSSFADVYPHQLSGGMMKRAEIVRVLAIDPEVLLMDEPFGALDAQTKIHMQNLLLDMLQKLRKTVIFITHDLEEAVVLSDRVVTMTARPGRILREHAIDLPRPRDSRNARLDPRFQQLLRAVWEDIEPVGDRHAV
jgi:NitT/TauT family transport system ATP-binding protein